MSGKLSKQNKLLKNTIWFSLGLFSSKAITFMLVPFYTNILTTSEYSSADIISSTVSLVMPFFTLLITSAVFRFVIEKKGYYNEIFSLGLFVILVGTLLVVIISYFVFQNVQNFQHYWIYFVAIYLFSALSNLFSEFILGLEMVKSSSIIGIVHTLIFALSNILFLVIFKMRVEGYLLAYIISSVVSVVLYFVCGKLYNYIVNPFHGTKMLWKKMIRYSLPMIPNSALWWITNSSDRYFVLFLVSASANGILSVSYKIPTILSIFVATFKSAWDMSVVEDFENEKGKNFFKQVYQKYIEFIVVISSGLIITSKILGYILYASDFFEAWKLSAILIGGFAFHSISGFLGSAFTAAKQTRVLFYSTLLGAVVNLIGNYFLIIWIGTPGAVIATGISYFLTMIYRRIAVKKYIIIKDHLARNISCYTLMILQIVLVYIDRPISFCVAIVIFISICLLNRKLFTDLLDVMIKRLKR